MLRRRITLAKDGLHQILAKDVSLKPDPEFTDLCSTDQSPYKVSKIGVNRLAEIQAKTLTSNPSLPGLLVNSVSQLI